MTFNILIDSGFWIALYNPSKDPKRSIEAERISEEIEDELIIVPFPTLYEFVDSRLSRREAKLEFEKLLNWPNVRKLSDNKYKEQALDNFFLKTRLNYTDLSLVDEILKLIIADKQISIDYIVSFDQGLINDAISKGVKTI